MLGDVARLVRNYYDKDLNMFAELEVMSVEGASEAIVGFLNILEIFDDPTKKESKKAIEGLLDVSRAFGFPFPAIGSLADFVARDSMKDLAEALGLSWPKLNKQTYKNVDVD
jgi:hypothetical protein